MTNNASTKTISDNKLRAILAYALRTAALLCSNGSLIQTFLSAIGFPEQYIYIHASLYQAANVLTILLCARFADTRHVLRRTAMVQIPGALLFLCYLPFCITKNVPSAAYFWLIGIGVLQSVTMALHTVCEYKTPYYIYKPEEYGSVLAVCGILSSVISFGVGALMRLGSSRYPYPQLMGYAFAVSFFFLLMAAVLQFFQKSLIPLDGTADTEQKEQKQEKIPLTVMFRHEAFSHLFAGNLLRGIANGLTTVLAASALSLGYDETLTTAMVSVQSLAALAGCALFAFLSRRIPSRYAIFGGSICFLALPLMLIRDTPMLFLVLYAVLMFGRTLIDYAVPSALLYAVPVEIAGTYNAWRMILHNAGTLLATTLAGFLPLPVMVGITVVCQLLSGWNFLAAKVMRRTQ